MSVRKIYIDCHSPFYRIALMQDGRLEELILNDKNSKAEPRSIYVGRIEKILPSGFAFVNIGEGGPAFMQLGSGGTIKGQKVTCNQELAVQVTKEAYDEKKAAVTADITRGGRYCVVINDSKHNIGVSSKITDPEKREALSDIARNATDAPYSIIVRTAAGETDSYLLEDEIRKLCSEMDEITEKAKYTRAPALIYKTDGPLVRLLKDLSGEDCEVIINDEEYYEKIKEYYPDTELYTDDMPLFMNYGIENMINALFQKKVRLKGGGYIVIDETEALTVIDVNSGKDQDPKKNFRVNREAAAVIARQIRLRNLSGMILIDFINMKSDQEREELCTLLKQELLRDRVKIRILGITQLGLMQITRQKIRKPLSRYIYHTCPMCGGLGSIKEKELIANDIYNSLINILSTNFYNEIILSASAPVIEAARTGCEELEKKYNAKIRLEVLNTGRFDHYEIEKIRKSESEEI